MYQVVTTSTFEKDCKLLDKVVAKRIIQKIEFLSAHSEPPGQFLTGMPKELKGLRKYRIGDWRILFFVTADQIILYGVEHRRSVYKLF